MLTLEERFWPKVDVTGGCWLWTGATNGVGYGCICRGRPLRGNEYAHRLSYAWANGVIPEGLDIDHLCRVRNCVNPSHLEAVTRSVNLRRSPLVGRTRPVRMTCPSGHVLRDENLRINSLGWRSCRMCSRLGRRAYYAAHAEQEKRKNREYHTSGRRPRQQRTA